MTPAPDNNQARPPRMGAAGQPTLQEAAAGLMAGQPSIFPTDTVYGLGVAVGFAPTPELLYDIKERDHGKPVAWLVGSLDDLGRYGQGVPEYAFGLARAFWPGPLTLIVKAAPAVPAAFRSADQTIALRMPDNETALGLIRQVGVPLATTSANISGQKPPQAFDGLDKRLLEKVALAIRDDTAKSGVASTVVDCTGQRPAIVREGGIPAAEVQAFG